MRFTDPNKWRDPQFRELKPNEKLLAFYILENCDNAGFITHDNAAAAWHTRINSKALPQMWHRLETLIVICDGWVWVKDFPKLQKNYPLNKENGAHRQVIRQLAAQSERFKHVPQFRNFIAPFEGLLAPPPGLLCASGIGKGSGEGINIGIGSGNGSDCYTHSCNDEDEIGSQQEEINKELQCLAADSGASPKNLPR